MSENYQNSIKKILEEYAIAGVRETNKSETERLRLWLKPEILTAA